MSTDLVELRKLAKQVSASTSDEETLQLLGRLKKEFTVNEQILRESKAGLAVGKLRQHSSRAIADAAKDLVKKWKNEVEQAKTAAGSNTKTAAVIRKTQSTAASSNASAASSQSKSDVRNAKSDGIKTTFTGDKTRDACVILMYDALAFDSGAPSEQISQRAVAIEKAVFNEFGSTTAAYKSKMRSFFVNLKDKNNPGLRASVVSGGISAERFSKMTSQDMASAERKAADDKIKEENLFKTLAAEEQQAETDAFQCSRCKQRKCRYRQAQTRSADEPMTTFVTCTVCNNRWKFS